MASFQSSTKSIRNPDAGEDTRPINRPASKLAIVRQLPQPALLSIVRQQRRIFPVRRRDSCSLLVAAGSRSSDQIKLRQYMKQTRGLRPFIPQKQSSRQSWPLTARQPLGYMANVGKLGTCAT